MAPPSKFGIGLRLKIILLSVLPSLFIVVMISWLSNQGLIEIANEASMQQAKPLAAVVNSTVHTKKDLDPVLLDSLLARLKQFYPNIDHLVIYVLDNNQPKRISSSRKEEIKATVGVNEVVPILTGKNAFREDRQKNLIEILEPILLNNQPVASIGIYLPTDPRDRLLFKETSRLLSTAVVGFFLLTFILYFFLDRLIVRPVSHIKEVADQIAQGDPKVKVQLVRTDEMGMLANAINTMSDSLRLRSNLLIQEMKSMNAVQEISQAILSTLSLDEITERLLRHIRQLIPYDIISISLVDLERRRFRRIAITGEPSGLLKKGETALLSDSSLLTRAVESRQLVIVDDLSQEHGRKALEERLLGAGIRSGLVLPLIAKGRVIGTMNLGSFSLRHCSDEILKLALDFSQHVAVAIENAQLYEHQKREAQISARLLETSKFITSSLHLQDRLERILDSVYETVGGDSCSIMLLDDKKQVLTIKAARGLDPRYVRSAQQKMGEGIAGWAAAQGQPLLLQDTIQKDRFTLHQEHEKKIVSSICIPMKSKDRLIGVLSVNSTSEDRRFNQEDLKVLTLFSSQAASAIENAQLFEQILKKTEELKEANFDSVKALAEALETKDVYTRGHSDRTVELSGKIAQALGLSDQEIDWIRYAAILHDIGKIGIPEQILNKPAKLTAEEYELMKKHPVFGAQIVGQIKFLAPVVLLVRHDHERWDGKGYPDGLKGEAIPLGARIVTVVDAYDAMTTDRVYRKAPGKAFAIEELKHCAGSQFDPQIVEIFLDMIEPAHSVPHAGRQRYGG